MLVPSRPPQQFQRQRVQPRFEPGTDIALYVPPQDLIGQQAAAQQMVPQNAFLAEPNAPEEFKVPDVDLYRNNAENLQRMQQVIPNENEP